ncbi:CDP-glucose 4,6-dehydratase [Parablautia muri]|uniref:CDP-glucose 4,6-dehydratase n=1 Tax=Parablautia muri TaxID=2320879 RepID=A0A9X5BF53_9FIRM|nr:CDP-glucose 4,6-dehydratase [Parablautia muri]NBJ92507.1 CDP-glucose 4,6-dehydratase [Parablautia muri]
MNFWTGRKVFLTGHTGFKGTWLCKMLEMLGAEVYGYALEEDTEFFTMAQPKISKSVLGDIADKEKLLLSMEDGQPEIVIHFASHSTLNRSYEITDYIFNTNVMGLVNLLECVRKIASIKAVLVVTSDKCYKNMESEEGYQEDSVLGGGDPYSASKACQELIVECYRNSFFTEEKLNIPIATARASNVIGGGDYHYDRLLPGLVRSFLYQEDANVRKPDAIRPWQNVLDVLGGYLCLVQKMVRSENADSIYSAAFNFGPEPDGIISVRRLVEMIAEHFEKNSYNINNALNVDETKVLKINSSKAKSILEWQRVYSIEETVKMAVLFEQRRFAGESVKKLCEEYVNDFFGRKKYE